MFIVKHTHRFKGLSQKYFVPWARKTEFKCRNLKVNGSAVLLRVWSNHTVSCCCLLFVRITCMSLQFNLWYYCQVCACVLFMQFSVFMLQIMKEYVLCFEQPRILGLTAPLLNSTCDPGRLEGELRRLELVLHSEAETASDIVSVLR